MKTTNYKVPFRGRFAYAMGDVGCNFVWTTVGSFLTYYYTDSVGISAALVGTLMLITRLIDAFTDLGMGTILDHTKTRWGKARPWILWSTPMMAIGLVALFSVPGTLGEGGKAAYAIITYIFVACFAYTASNLSYNTLLSLMTDDVASRVSANSIRFICTAFLTILLSYTTRPLAERFSWTGMAMIYAVAATICFLITFFGVHEEGVNDAAGRERDRIGGAEGFKMLFKNRYFLTTALLFICYYLCATLFNSMGIYFARDVLGNADLYGTLTTCTRIPMVISLMAVPALASRFGKWKCMVAGCLMMIAGLLMMYFGTPHVAIVLLGVSIRGFGMGPINAGIFSLVADVVDYGEWKNGVRQAGLTNSATSFGMKVGTGFGSAFVGWGLAFGGYNKDLAVQAASTLFAEKMMYMALPCVGIAICLICLYFTNLDKMLDQIHREMDERLGK